jgi:signal peptidase I
VNSLPAIDAEIRDDGIVPSYRANFAYCPNANCQFPNNVLDKEMFAGDRILVNKFPYEFRDPERWDVVVFKFPEQAKTNYIKRLAGLPGEELKIKGGDVWVRPLSEENGVFRIPRKTPEKQRKLQLLVHDDNRPATKLIAAGWPESWEPADLVTTGWVADRKARAYRVDPKPGESDHVHWMRYTHYLPSAAEWTRALAGQGPAQTPRAQLIKDLYAYNRRVTASQSEARSSLPREI